MTNYIIYKPKDAQEYITIIDDKKRLRKANKHPLSLIIFWAYIYKDFLGGPSSIYMYNKIEIKLRVIAVCAGIPLFK